MSALPALEGLGSASPCPACHGAVPSPFRGWGDRTSDPLAQTLRREQRARTVMPALPGRPTLASPTREHPQVFGGRFPGGGIAKPPTCFV